MTFFNVLLCIQPEVILGNVLSNFATEIRYGAVGFSSRGIMLVFKKLEFGLRRSAYNRCLPLIRDELECLGVRPGKMAEPMEGRVTW